MTDAHDDPALLLTEFVNTLNIDADRDEIPSPARLVAWLAEHRLVPADAEATGADLDTALTLREALRDAMAANHRPRGAGPPDDLDDLDDLDDGLPDDLDDALAGLPLRVTLTGPRPALVPLDPPATAAAGLARIAAAIAGAAADGAWPRLKTCQQDTCRWAFLDTSKNRSRSWCSMSTCGNRTKTRAYRARRRPAAG